MCAHVVVVEDDRKQAELVRRYLEHDGHSVVVVHDGRTALEEVRARPPHLVVLDIMLPRVAGWDVCRILRQESDVPLLMLTARSTEDDLLLGLDLGADDYLTKPYSPRELMARVRSLLRRGGSSVEAHDPAIRLGRLRVDPVRHEVSVDGRPVACTPAEFQLLHAMAAQPGRVFSHEQLLGHLHGIDRYVTVRTIDSHVMNLRRKIEPDPSRPTWVVTVYGVGYKLADRAK